MNNELIVILVSVLGICVFLPALVVWMVSRRKMYEAEKRTEIALSYMKENPHCDLEDLVRKIEPKVDKNAMLLPLFIFLSF